MWSASPFTSSSLPPHPSHRAVAISRNRSGALVASEAGQALSNGLANAQERGITFISPGTEVYEGMIVGQNARPDDLAVNVCKGKKLTNMRASGSDDNVLLEPPRKMTLEEQPDIDIVPGTPEERFAMVWRITVDVWASSGRKIPDYRREDAPVTIIRGVRR